MRNVFSISRGGIFLLVAMAVSSCASDHGSGDLQSPTQNNGVTIGPATVAGGTSDFESPWPFGPLGMD